jgi:hypothetical protein
VQIVHSRSIVGQISYQKLSKNIKRVRMGVVVPLLRNAEASGGKTIKHNKYCLHIRIFCCTEKSYHTIALPLGLTARVIMAEWGWFPLQVFKICEMAKEEWLDPRCLSTPPETPFPSSVQDGPPSEWPTTNSPSDQ